jgi:hypothetical protein
LLAVAILALKINSFPDTFHPGFVVNVCGE